MWAPGLENKWLENGPLFLRQVGWGTASTLFTAFLGVRLFIPKERGLTKRLEIEPRGGGVGNFLGDEIFFRPYACFVFLVAITCAIILLL